MGARYVLGSMARIVYPIGGYGSSQSSAVYALLLHGTFREDDQLQAESRNPDINPKCSVLK